MSEVSRDGMWEAHMWASFPLCLLPGPCGPLLPQEGRVVLPSAAPAASPSPGPGLTGSSGQLGISWFGGQWF